MKIVDNSLIGSSDEVSGVVKTYQVCTSKFFIHCIFIQVNRLLERVEVTFVKHFSSGNRREGMKCLRPKVKRERHRVTFFSGKKKKKTESDLKDVTIVSLIIVSSFSLQVSFLVALLHQLLLLFSRQKVGRSWTRITVLSTWRILSLFTGNGSIQ